MKKHGQISPRALGRAIETAKRLVEGNCDPAVPPGERLRQLGEKLKVTRIEPGALDASGFLAIQPDGTFAVYYANEMPERCRYTIAHELAHLILNRYCKHLRTTQTDCPLAGRRSSRQMGDGSTQSSLAPHSLALEGAVDRIAAEILMPEQLVIPLMQDICLVERESSREGVIDKRKALQAVRNKLGVSEFALVRRLMELTELLAVRYEFQWAEHDLFSQSNRTYDRIGIWRSKGLDVELDRDPSRSNLEGEDGWELQVQAKAAGRKRTIRCQGWQRSAAGAGLHVTWVVGWTWNAIPKPKWDDSLE